MSELDHPGAVKRLMAAGVLADIQRVKEVFDLSEIRGVQARFADGATYRWREGSLVTPGVELAKACKGARRCVPACPGCGG